MFCTRCGKEIDEGNKFCSHCGKQSINAEGGRNRTAPWVPAMDALDLLIFVLFAVLILIWIVAALIGWKPDWKIFSAMKFRHQVLAFLLYLVPPGVTITLCVDGIKSLRKRRYRAGMGGAIILICILVKLGYKLLFGVFIGAVASIPYRVCRAYNGITGATIIIGVIIAMLLYWKHWQCYRKVEGASGNEINKMS